MMGIGGWFDRKVRWMPGPGERLYSVSWILSWVDVEQNGPIKLAVAAALTALVVVIADGLSAFNQFWWITAGAWAVDVILGVWTAARDPNDNPRLEKLLDGFTKLFLLLTLPPLFRAAEIQGEALADGLDTFGVAAVAVTAALFADFAGGILEKGARYVPYLRRVQGRLIRWEEGEPVQESRTRVTLLDDSQEED